MNHARWYRVTRPDSHFSLWEGDILRYDPTTSPEIQLFRALPPNHGYLLGLVEDGALTSCDADLPAHRLLSSPRPPASPEPRPPAQIPQPGLRVVR